MMKVFLLFSKFSIFSLSLLTQLGKSEGICRTPDKVIRTLAQNGKQDELLNWWMLGQAWWCSGLSCHLHYCR